MRKWITLVWLLSGVVIFAYHYNYGPKQIQREKAWALLQEIRSLETAEDRNIDEVLLRYNDGQPRSHPVDLWDALPEDEDPKVFYQIRLTQVRLRLEAYDVGKALPELEELLTECADAYGENADLTAAVRETLGKAQYMAAWTLQGVGAPPEEWRAYAERARQVFRYLAEHSDPKAYGDYEAQVHRAFAELSDNK
ncbi:MAG: hypothetical protein GC164_15500 [Phycisphaera sp.]|nr:hypothetical protein [Phycisphaera sp.]